jgi:hypothetical protein
MAAHVGCSVLSSDEEACCLLAGCPAFPAAALTILKKYPGRQDIVVRITYCLGKGGSISAVRTLWSASPTAWVRGEVSWSPGHCGPHHLLPG